MEEHIFILYDENGNVLDDSHLIDQILDFWSDIYQKHRNNMNEEWFDDMKNTYIERYGNQELVHREPNNEEANYISFLWRIARGERSQMSREEIAGFRVQNHIVNQSENENVSVEWMPNLDFSGEDVRNQLIKLKKNKKAGPNGLKNEIYKWLLGSEMCVNSLATCYNNVKQIGPPIEWKNSKTVLIPKKKKPTCRDLRPIALTDSSYRIYMSMCKNKIIKHLVQNNQFSVYQSGFTKGRRLEDNLFTLTYCITESRKRKEPLFVCAIDYEKAFDSIKRSSIIKTLIKYRCEPQLIDVICQLYDRDTTSVYFNNKLVGQVEISSGIRQGCTGSPLLFIMVLNSIIDKIERSRVGFRSGNIRIPCLFFADDGLLLAQSERDMRRIIGTMERAAEDVGLKINKAKSNIMVYGHDFGNGEIEDIKVVTSIKYLGVNISDGRDPFKNHKEQKLKDSKKLSNMTYSIIARSCNKLLIGKTYWDMVVIPSLLFASAIINWNKTELETLQRSEDAVWRKILGAPGYAPLVAMRGDVGATTIMARDIKSKLKYVRHIYNCDSDLLGNILDGIMNGGHPYGKKILKYLGIINIEQVSDLREISAK